MVYVSCTSSWKNIPQLLDETTTKPPQNTSQGKRKILSKVLLFDDNANLLHFSKSFSKLYGQTNLELKNLAELLNASKNCLNVGKTKLLIFKQRRQILEKKSKLSFVERGFIFLSMLRY